MPVVGGYTMDLYCDTEDSCPSRGYSSLQGQYYGHNESECLRQARRDGWKFKEGNTLAYCPKCSKGLKR